MNTLTTKFVSNYLALPLLVVALLFSGCDLMSSDDDSPAVEVGIVAWETDASNSASAQTYNASKEPYTEDFEPLTAPNTAQAGESFEVEVRTVAPNGCYEADRVETEQDALLIEITPYDLDRTDAEGACPDVIGLIKRTLNLQFDTPGEALIRLNGQHVIGNDFSNRDATTIEHELTVVE